MGRKAADEKGNVYGRLTVLERDGTKYRKAAWKCQCSCGSVKTVTGSGLREGRITSCGCYQVEVAKGKLILAHEWQKDHKPTKAQTKYREYKNRVEGRYNISIQQVVDKMNLQKGCCGICGRSLFQPNDHSTAMHIDHDHNTGFMRGLLCRSCNLMIGYSYDSIKTLGSGRDYLRRYHSGKS